MNDDHSVVDLRDPAAGAAAPPPRPLRRRVAAIAAGTALSALAFDLVLRAELGLGPWHVLTQGIALQTGLEIGTASIVLQLALLAVSLVLRERPGVGTVVAAVVLGVLIDALLPHVPEPTALPVRVTFLLVGTALMSLGGALYITAALGAAPLDAVMTAIYRHVPLSLSQVRLGLEAVGLAGGVLLGGEVGAGSVLIGLGIGPLLQMWLRVLGGMPAKWDDIESATAITGADPALGAALD